jgi:hypothetical protein
LEGWVGDPARQLRLRQIELDRLSGIWKRELLEHSKLIQQPHWFVSISCPTPFHGLYDAQDGWLCRRVQTSGRRTSDGVQGILDSLAGTSLADREFVHILRVLFRKRVLEAVQSLYPGIELAMEHQLHPCNKWDNAPDVHLLICKWGWDKASGKRVEVAFDALAVHRAVEAGMRLLAEFVMWTVKRWNNGCRATAFRNWRRDVLEACAEVIKTGISGETVDVVLVPVAQLLNVHCYLRRQPMENVKSLFLHRDKGMADVYYWDGKRASFSLIDLLWRFVGFDGRGLGVQYSGAYRSVRGAKRDQKVDAMYRALELMQDDQKNMLKVKIDGAENDEIQNV